MFKFTRLAVLATLTAASTAGFAQTVIQQSKVNGWPYVISQPGSYKLASNLVVPVGMSGIRIDASDVTLDLNGFSINGPVTCGYANYTLTCDQTGGTTIGMQVAGHRATIRGGGVRGFAGAGVYVNGNGFKLVDVDVTQNTVYGVWFNGALAGMLDRVHVAMNDQQGVNCRNGLVSNSAIELNGGDGLSGLGCSVTDSVIRANKSAGINGLGSVLVRGTRILNNGTNRTGTVHSGGGNLDDGTVF